MADAHDDSLGVCEDPAAGKQICVLVHGRAFDLTVANLAICRRDANVCCGSALAAAFGLSQLFLLVPAAYDVVRFIGAAYLLYLAWQAFTRAGLMAPLASEQKRHSTFAVFRQGLFTNLLNPKMALFVLALFPQFVRADAGDVALQIMVLATVLNAIGLVVNGLVILAASRAGGAMLARGGLGRWPQYFLGGVFAGLALRLAFDRGR